MSLVTVAYMLHGAFCCQAIWYFRNFKTDRSCMKLLVSAITIMQSINFCLVAFQLHYYLVGRGVGTDWTRFVTCFHWSYITTCITTEACCFLVEGFYLYRMRTFLRKKSLIFAPIATFAIGWAFTIYMIIQTARYPCVPDVIRKTVAPLVASYGCRIVTDGIITLSMTCMLQARKTLASSRANTMTLLRNLMVWSVSTGAIMW
ncbi:hypothetical protein BJ165DRAFT_555938 [Panaeolus papilionaceus]|nr:hypothetical protein BJ165DRAFT_555938 [Panaeolus papilionaceus]